MEKAKDYCAYAASCGVIPLAPHTIFTQYLNDAVPEQREQGLRMGHELLERCDELWVMGDTISQGMKDEIGLATFLQLPILYVSDDMVKNQTMIRQSDRPLDINDCIPDSSQYNYENQFLVLKPGVSSKGEDMTADDSIWYARNGFGCIYGARGQAVYAESLLTGKYIHWERHDFCGIVKPESLKEWLLDKPVRNEAAEELTKFVTPELISAAKQNHTACGYPFLIGYLVTGETMEDALDELTEALSEDGMQRYVVKAPVYEQPATQREKAPEPDEIIPYRWNARNIRIAVAGSQRRSGVTVTAFNLASWLAARGAEVAYIEVNQNRHLQLLLNIYEAAPDGEHYTIDGIDCYLTNEPDKAYQFIIYDCGVMQTPTSIFRDADHRLLCGSVLPYEIPVFHKALSECGSLEVRPVAICVPQEIQEYCMELFGENVQIAAASHDLFAKRVNGQIYRPLVEKYIAGEKRL